MKKKIDETLGVIRFTFEGLEAIVFDPKQASLANQDYAILHGFAARIGDNAALVKGPENGFKITEEMRREAVLELTAHYESGTEEWNVKASGVRKPAQNPAISALATALGLSYEETMAKLAEDAVMAMKAGE